MPENLQIPRHLDAQGFLRSVARMRGLPAARVDAAIDPTRTATGLERSAWRRAAGGWSKGMRQRAGLAAALLGEPELLVLDEPTDGIDPLGRAAIRDVVSEAAAAGTTVFLKSHLLAETEQICDRVAIMRAGQVVLEGPLERLRATDRIRVVLVDGEGTQAVATTAGLRPDPERDRPGQRAYTLASAEPEAVSAVLQHVLAEGVHVVEVMRPMRTLEDVMREAVQ